MNLFTRVPGWLRGALGTTGPQLPNTLDTSGVLPVVDVFRGGIADVEVSEIEILKPASSPGGFTTVVQWGFSQLSTRLLLGLEVKAQGYAVAPWSHLRHRVHSGTSVVQIDIGSVEHDSTKAQPWPMFQEIATLKHYAGTSDPIWVPPQWGMVLSLPVTGVGESWLIHGALITLPEGSELGL